MTTRTLTILPATLPPSSLTPAEIGTWVRHNLALDEALLLHLGKAGAPALRCYVNPPSVILGLSRRIALDVHREACATAGVGVYRRASGGGTVYHDRGVLNVAWILPWAWLPGCGPKSLTDATTPTFLGLLIAACRELGIPAKATRISDVSIGDPLRKIAGSGQARKAQGVLHHASLLVDLDLPAMSRCLPNPPDRPDIDHAAFVTSLSAAGLPRGWPGMQRMEAALRAMTLAQFGAEAAGEAIAMEVLAESAQLTGGKYGDERWITRL